MKKSEQNKQDVQVRGTWPMPIEVGDLVFPALITSPDVGEVVSITKNGRWAAVKWRSNGLRKRERLDRLISVNKALTAFNLLERGMTPCRSCGYEATDVYGKPTENQICNLCSSAENPLRDGPPVSDEDETP